MANTEINSKDVNVIEIFHESSNIKRSEYYPKEQVLIIEFHSGGIYKYHPVPKKFYNRFVKADSTGKFFHRGIKTNPDIKYTKLK